MGKDAKREQWRIICKSKPTEHTQIDRKIGWTGSASMVLYYIYLLIRVRGQLGLLLFLYFISFEGAL